MKLLAELLLWTSLAVGSLSAATAYLVPIDQSEDGLDRLSAQELTLNADAGIKVSDRDLIPSALVPSVDSAGDSTVLTRDVIDQLRTNDSQLADLANEASRIDRRIPRVRHVRVKEFSFARWPGKWVFGISLIGMVVASVIMRKATAGDTQSVSKEVEQDTPLEMLREINAEVQSLRQSLDELSDDEARRREIVQRVGKLQKHLIPAFVDSRHRLAKDMGLGHMAELMNQFSAAERQLNRAWTTATDGDAREASDCLAQAVKILSECAATF